jgi:methyl-accepting chemotaxis protein
MQVLINTVDISLYIVELSVDAKLLKCNEKFLQDTGYQLNDLKNKEYKVLMDTEEFVSYQETLRQLKKGKIVRKEVKRIKKNGDTVWLDATYCPVLNENGELNRIFKLSYDISEKKKQAANIDNLLKDMKVILTATDEALYVVELSVDAKLIKCNDKFLKDTGYAIDDLQGKDYKILMDTLEYANYQETLAQLKQGKTVRKEVKRTKKNGVTVWLDATYCPVLNEEKQLSKIFKMSFDITEKKTQAELIERLQKSK